MRTAFRAGALAAIGLPLVSLTTVAHAGTSDYARAPLVQEGEREIDFKAQSSFHAWEWENKFQLTETGKDPVDIGFLVEIERLLFGARDGSPQTTLRLQIEYALRRASTGPPGRRPLWRG